MTQPDPDFDGHLEVPFVDLTPDQKLDWLWELILLQTQSRRVKNSDVTVDACDDGTSPCRDQATDEELADVNKSIL